jgi:glycosyltransferase involved in cell wall biosynthesis
MKVTLLIQRIANRAGGAERVVVNVANQLSRNGAKVEVLTFETTDGRPFYPLDCAVNYRNLGIMSKAGLSGFERCRGALAKWCQTRSDFFLLGRLAWQLIYGQSVKRLRSHLESQPSDLLIAFLPSSFTITAEVAGELGLPFILSSHSVPEEDFENPERWDQNPVDKRRRMDGLRRADAITVILPEFRDWFPEDIRGNVHVIRNFITHPPVSYPPLAERTKRILAVGRYSKPKDHETLLRAWSLIAREFPDWVVEIYGEGPLNHALKGLLSTLGIQSTVSLKPPSSEIWDLYGDSRIFCIPSIFEGFGLVTAEAMACGTPAVGFKSCPGTNRIILDGETGVLVDCLDDQKVPRLAEALKQLMLDESLSQRYATRSLAAADAYFVENRIADWFALVDSLSPVKSATIPHSPA